MNRQLFLSLTSFCGLLYETTVVAQPATDYATKALSGDVIGGESLAGVSVFVPARILETGGVFFTADLDNGEQAFMNDQEIAIVTGAQVVGAAIGTEISFLGRAAVNEVGDIVMSVLLDGTAVDVTNNSALVAANGAASKIVQKGDPLPGTSESVGDIFSARILPTTTGDSHPGAYSTTILEPSGNSAIFSLPGNGSPLVVEAVGDMVGDESVEQLSSPTTNNSRRVALYVRKWPGTVPQTDHAQAVLYQNDGSKFVLLETGDSGFGLPVGTTIKDLFVPKTNDQDDLTVFTEYQGFVSGESIHQFQIDGTSVTSGRSVAKTGEPAPGVPGQGFSFFQNFVVNQSGDVAFQAILDALIAPGTAATMGPDEGAAPIVGIWYEDPTGTLQLAVHDGLQAPGLDAGVTIEQVDFPAFNDLNQVAFLSKLTGPGVDPFVNDEALWATDQSGDLQLVARTGDLFDVDNNPLVEDLRTIVDIGVIANSGGTGGEDTSFNDLGELAFVLRFTDATSGLFVASFAAPTFPGDFDNDGDVDGRDFLIWQRGGSPTPLSAGDLGDWQANYGGGSLAAEIVAVPEPCAIGMSLVGACGLLARRSKR